MALFDYSQKVMFTSTLSVFGDEAVWVESGNASSTHTAKVLYNSPSVPIKLGKSYVSVGNSSNIVEYLPYDYSFEFYEGAFPGLKTSVDAGALEYVTVCTLRLAVRELRATADGKSFIAYCELAPNE